MARPDPKPKLTPKQQRSRDRILLQEAGKVRRLEGVKRYAHPVSPAKPRRAFFG